MPRSPPRELQRAYQRGHRREIKVAMLMHLRGIARAAPIAVLAVAWIGRATQVTGVATMIGIIGDPAGSCDSTSLHLAQMRGRGPVSMLLRRPGGRGPLVKHALVLILTLTMIFHFPAALNKPFQQSCTGLEVWVGNL